MRLYRTILNAGIYDLLHKGHLNLLRQMRKMGKQTVIVLHDDQSCYQIKDKFPIQSLERRKWQLEHSGLVDKVLITKSTDPASEFQQAIDTHEDILYVRGDDLIDEFPGKWLLDKNKIPIHYLPYTNGISSTQIKDKLWS